MCKPHWNQYTAALARDAKARKAAAAGPATEVEVASPSEPAAMRKRCAVEATAADEVRAEAGS